MSAIQVAWRFYNNDRVDTYELFESIRAESRDIIENIDSDFILVAHNWSWLDFKNHKAKEDLIVRDKKGNAKQIGYELHTSLLINPNNGNPLAPIAMNLQTSKEVGKVKYHKKQARLFVNESDIIPKPNKNKNAKISQRSLKFQMFKSGTYFDFIETWYNYYKRLL
jgi:hypothetical protein